MESGIQYIVRIWGTAQHSEYMVYGYYISVAEFLVCVV